MAASCGRTSSNASRCRCLRVTTSYCARRHRAAFSIGSSGLRDLSETNIEDWVLLPIFVVEVPPLGFVNGEAFRFHCGAQQIAMPALQRSTARIIWISTIGRLVVSAHHLDGLLGLQIVKRDIDRA